MRCLPLSFVDASVRGVTNTDGRLIGVSFDLENGEVVRLALPFDQAESMAKTIRYYLESYRRTNSQSDKSSGNPSEEVSAHRGWENV